MKKIIFLVAVTSILLSCGSAKSLLSADKATIITDIDLANTVDDKVMVTLNPGAFTSEQVTFFIPKTVPGTYSTDNYGNYIDGLKALDYDGQELAVNKTDDNTWLVQNGKNLDKITYQVNDTFDTEDDVAHVIFSPAGTNILAGENFMLNLHGFVGYFKGLTETPYEIQIIVPQGLTATTSLTRKTGETGDSKDVFVAPRYFEVIDNPILYAKANNESFQLKDITVGLSVYSPNGTYTAADLKERMQTMMTAQKAFLGDIDGTKEYNILLYLSTLQPNDASGFGALEHHTSTVVVLPEQMPKEQLEQSMVDVVSHEFFHIVTPLNIHSEEIQFFDFNAPKMSEHLWMYEGTTEYFANLFQIQQELIDETEFYNRIMGKITNAKAYDDTMSFTTMSKNILVEPYKKNYANVYEKGALINMVLDIIIRDNSKGERGVLWLMKELSKKYGDNTPFKDEKLLKEIVSMTYPEVDSFFNTHLLGNTPINYTAYLAKVGLTTSTSEVQSGYFLHGNVPYIDIDPAMDNAVFIRKGIELNTFLKDLDVQGGDVIKSINGIPMNLEAIRTVIGQSFAWTPETDISMVVIRGGQEMTLTGKVGTPMVTVETIIPIKDSTEQHVQLREAWLKG